MRAALAGRGIGGYRLNALGVTGRPDFVFREARLAVFIHGCFWHRCPHCRPGLPRRHRAFWTRKFELNKERDIRKRAELERAGWTVLEFWECQVQKELGRCVRATTLALTARARRRTNAGMSTMMVADGRRRGLGR